MGSKTNLQKSEQLQALVLLTVFFTLVISFLAWCIVKLSWNKRVFGINNRNPDLVILYSWAALVLMATRVSTCWLEYYGIYERSNWLETGLSALQGCVTSASYVVFGLGVGLRIWLLYFDAALAVASDTRQWSALITAPVMSVPVLRGGMICVGDDCVCALCVVV